MSTALVQTYASEDGSTVIESLDGVMWADAPIPPRKHECWVQTRGWTNYFTQTLRCACGGISMDGRYWSEKNSRNTSTPERTSWLKRWFR